MGDGHRSVFLFFVFLFSLFFVFLDLDYLVEKNKTMELAWLYGSYCRLLELPSFM